MKTLVCLGNEYVQGDNAAATACSLLKNKANVVFCSSIDQLLDLIKKGSILVDAADGIEKPLIVRDPGKITNKLRLSLHDFDAGFFLRLAKEIGIMKRFTLIAIPRDYPPRKAATAIRKFLG
jgi:Ni,Fe-hydrogenase maturation factor